MINEETSGRNSCCHYDLTRINSTHTHWIFPSYYLEDYFIDDFDDLDVPYDIVGKRCLVPKEEISWDHLYILRTHAYSASVWYEPLKKYTFASEFLNFIGNDDIEKVLEDVEFPKFIKLDTVSAKDTGHSCVFNSAADVASTFKSSNRIQNTLTTSHKYGLYTLLFVREVDPDIVQGKGFNCRCFIYHRKLTSVSCHINDMEKSMEHKIKKYINDVIPDMPYTDATIDIFISTAENRDLPSFREIKIIELNGFGADSPTGSGNYNWKDDYIIIHSDGNDVDFRYEIK